eukprot:s5893_g1.t1
MCFHETYNISVLKEMFKWGEWTDLLHAQVDSSWRMADGCTLRASVIIGACTDASLHLSLVRLALVGGCLRLLVPSLKSFITANVDGESPLLSDILAGFSLEPLFASRMA